MKELITQAVKFGAVGIVNTTVDFVALTLLSRVMPYTLANIISYGCGMLCSFALNKRFTFADQRRTTARRGIIFVAVNLISLGASTGVLTLGVEWLGLPVGIAKLISIPFSLAVNFVGNKLFVFGKESEGDA